ncbi:MAG: hypothetical protein BIP78_0539 [Candidatus Bipolaricaulis sibiricus]|uniref:Uncharacterized protein n=1 Tax=Bipolaricaulis sibiricus TaxID=2501609 RepID=A0A410FT96_BIPS1|nr:MAG: hypothetical protein BIP78_0539 [Candidatus Bipolaricaulis sibiricus]
MGPGHPSAVPREAISALYPLPMRWSEMRTRLLGALLVALVWGTTSWSQPLAVSGSLGIEVTFTPIPPADITSAITLGLTFGRAEIVSRTELSLAGLLAQYLTVGVSLDGVALRSGLRFDPCFSRYWFEVRGGCCPLELGGLFLVENLALACQTPNYTVGIVLDLGVAWRPGFFARSVTGFGVTDVYGLIDLEPGTWLTAVPGVWFEETLLNLGFAGACFRTDGLVLFVPYGLAWFELGGSYLYPDPEAELGVRIRILGTFALDWAKLFFGVRVPPVAVRLVTTFDLGGFLAQDVAVEVSFSWVRIYSRTRFDFGGLIQAIVGIELKF